PVITLFYSHRAADDVRNALIEEHGSIVVAAYAAPRLNRKPQLGDNVPDVRQIDKFPFPGTVQVNDMDMIKTRFLKFSGLSQGVLVVNGHLFIISFLQAYHLSVEQVNSGDDNHGVLGN